MCVWWSGGTLSVEARHTTVCSSPPGSFFRTKKTRENETRCLATGIKVYFSAIVGEKIIHYSLCLLYVRKLGTFQKMLHFCH